MVFEHPRWRRTAPRSTTACTARRRSAHRALLIASLLLSAGAQAQTVLRVRDDAPSGGDGARWETAFNSLDAALQHATGIAAPDHPVHLWVARGSYIPDLPLVPEEPASASFRIPAFVEVYGGFDATEKAIEERNIAANPTILDGALVAWHVVTMTASESVLDGFRITAGRAGFGEPLYSQHGGGLLIVNASPLVRDCVFQDNSTLLLGGNGGAVFAVGGNPTFERCDFLQNESFAGDGGAIATAAGGAVLLDCSFAMNHAAFGGGALAGSSLVAHDCAFIANSSKGGGAIYGQGRFIACRFESNIGGQSGGALFGTGASDFNSCIFTANTGGFDGGAAASPSSSRFVACTFTRNQTFGLGGAVSGSASLVCSLLVANIGSAAFSATGIDPRVINCTFVHNTGGGAFYTGPRTLTISNSIFWRNSAEAGQDEAAQVRAILGSINISHTFVQGLSGSLGGEGNLGGPESPSPGFINEAGDDALPGTDDDDLRLAPDSVCVDAASAAALPPDASDLDNDGDLTEPLPFDLSLARRRVDDPCVTDRVPMQSPSPDMGALERRPAAIDIDWNNDGILDSRDLFAFLRTFFLEGADFNRDGAFNAQDLFDYLALFMQPCP